MSLDKIEHGIIRKSKIKYIQGYFSKWFPDKFEKLFRMKKLDNRIHFALNCCTKSCPQIRLYTPKDIDK